MSINPHSYSNRQIYELRGICNMRGLPEDGTRDELIERVRADDTRRTSAEAGAQIEMDAETVERIVYTERERVLLAQLRAVTAALAEYGHTVPEWSADAPTYAERLGQTLRQVCQTAARAAEAEHDANMLGAYVIKQHYGLGPAVHNATKSLVADHETVWDALSVEQSDHRRKLFNDRMAACIRAARRMGYTGPRTPESFSNPKDNPNG
jgi:hypothetical protein